MNIKCDIMIQVVRFEFKLYPVQVFVPNKISIRVTRILLVFQ